MDWLEVEHLLLNPTMGISKTSIPSNICKKQRNFPYPAGMSPPEKPAWSLARTVIYDIISPFAPKARPILALVPRSRLQSGSEFRVISLLAAHW